MVQFLLVANYEIECAIGFVLCSTEEWQHAR